MYEFGQYIYQIVFEPSHEIASSKCMRAQCQEVIRAEQQTGGQGGLWMDVDFASIEIIVGIG